MLPVRAVEERAWAFYGSPRGLVLLARLKKMVEEMDTRSKIPDPPGWISEAMLRLYDENPSMPARYRLPDHLRWTGTS